MKRVSLMLSIAAATCSLVACKKDVEELTPKSSASAAATATPAAQLTATTWHQTGLVVHTTSEGQAVSADLFSHIKPGMLDQLATFQADGTYSVLKGGSDAQPQQGTWKLNAANDSVSITLPNRVRHLAVTALTPTTLSLSFADVADNGKVSTYTSTYSH
jgi:hypothetical protein